MMTKRFITHTLGAILIAMGVALIIVQNMGTQVWDAASLNLVSIFDKYFFSIDVGTAAFILNIFICIVCMIWGKSFKYLFVLVNALAFSLVLTPMTKLFGYLPTNEVLPYIWLTVGILLISVGINFLVIAKLIPMPAEALFVLIHTHLIKNYMFAKILLEAIFLIIAMILGSITGNALANLSYITIVVTLGISAVIQITNKPLLMIYERIKPNENK